MPKKLRELKSLLRKAGFIQRAGKGSHTVWLHPKLSDAIVLSGSDGDDAKPYQQRGGRRPGCEGRSKAIPVLKPKIASGLRPLAMTNQGYNSAEMY
jgi:predicted RNA binding protein YcfA (HicA-like mRNA interferase family)